MVTTAPLERIDYQELLEIALYGAAAMVGVHVVSSAMSSNTRRCHHPPEGEHLPPETVRALERGESVTIERWRANDLHIRGGRPLDGTDAESIEIEDVRQDDQDDSEDSVFDELEEQVELSESDGVIVARDTETGVADQGETTAEALSNLAEALEFHNRDVDHQPSDGLDVGAEAEGE